MIRTTINILVVTITAVGSGCCFFIYGEADSLEVANTDLLGYGALFSIGFALFTFLFWPGLLLTNRKSPEVVRRNLIISVVGIVANTIGFLAHAFSFMGYASF